MAVRDQHNFRPTFEATAVPCEGDVGDILVLTSLRPGEPDPEVQGSASIWFCIKGRQDERPAVWARVAFDGIATCDAPVPTPPQSRPILVRG